MLSLLLFLPSIASQFRPLPLNKYIKLGNTFKSDYLHKNTSLLLPQIRFNLLHYSACSSKMSLDTTSVALIPPGGSIVTINLNYNDKLITLNRSKTEILRSTLNRLYLSIIKAFDKDKNGKEISKLSLSDISLMDKDSNPIDLDTPIVDALMSAKYFSISSCMIPITVSEPFVKNLKLYIKPLTGSPILPDFELESGVNFNNLQFEWLNQQNDGTISIVYTSNHPTYNVDENLSGQLAVKIFKKGQNICYTSNYLPITKFDYAPWQYERISKFGIKDPNNVRVISFNILAPVYLTSYESISTFFPYCNPEALTLSHRIPLILRELTLLQPDIACLQEVSQNVYDDYLVKGLKNYQGWFKVKSGNVYEGCACMFNADRFELVETLDLNFNSLMRTPYYSCMAKQILKSLPEISFDNYHTIYQIGLLHEKANDRWIIVGNTHFYYHPSADYIRFIQALVFISQLESFENLVINKYKIPDSSLKMFVCGDLNSKPENSVYKLFTKGFVKNSHQDVCIGNDEGNQSHSNLPLHFGRPIHSSSVQMASGPTIPTEHVYPQDKLNPNIISTQRQKLSSVYKGAGLDGDGVELEFSNIVEKFDGLLDYIFYKNSKLIKALRGISKDEGRKDKGLPSLVYPSDHITIGADFDLNG